MELQQRLQEQRLKHVIGSYNLVGKDGDEFQVCLAQMIDAYPVPLIELAVVETLVEGWTTIPLVRGLDFLNKTHKKLQNWDRNSVETFLTARQFRHITGLDPTPVFGADSAPSGSRSPTIAG